MKTLFLLCIFLSKLSLLTAFTTSQTEPQLARSIEIPETLLVNTSDDTDELPGKRIPTTAGTVEYEEYFKSEPLEIQTTFSSRLAPAIHDFQEVAAMDNIEITAECFWSLLMNFLLAQDKSLRPGIKVTHQYNLKIGVEYGTPDIIIEKYNSFNKVEKAVIVELKFFDRPWEKKKWEEQLCSYILGYKVKKNIVAAGIISNMVKVYHYKCLDFSLKYNPYSCLCWVSKEYDLFGPLRKDWKSFNPNYFEKDYAPFFKGLLLKHGSN